MESKGSVNGIVMSFAMEAFEKLPREMQEFLQQKGKDPYARQGLFLGVIAGDCPVCGSFNTLDGGDTPLSDSTIGICLDCYRLTCLECGYILEKGKTICEHWKICEQCRPSPRENVCKIQVWNCTIIEEWKRKRD